MHKVSQELLAEPIPHRNKQENINLRYSNNNGGINHPSYPDLQLQAFTPDEITLAKRNPLQLWPALQQPANCKRYQLHAFFADHLETHFLSQQLVFNEACNGWSSPIMTCAESQKACHGRASYHMSKLKALIQLGHLSEISHSIITKATGVPAAQFVRGAPEMNEVNS